MAGGAGTKERIVDTALALFNERGTAAVSTRHVAGEMGISPGNLYYHFANKEEIVREILGRMSVSWREANALPEGRAPGLADLRGALGRHFSLLWDYRFFHRELGALLRRDPELARRYRDIQRGSLAGIERFFRAFVGAGVMGGELLEEPGALAALAEACWVIDANWLSFVEAGGRPAGPEDLARGADVIFRILRPHLTEGAPGEPGDPATENERSV